MRVYHNLHTGVNIGLHSGFPWAQWHHVFTSNIFHLVICSLFLCMFACLHSIKLTFIYSGKVRLAPMLLYQRPVSHSHRLQPSMPTLSWSCCVAAELQCLTHGNINPATPGHWRRGDYKSFPLVLAWLFILSCILVIAEGDTVKFGNESLPNICFLYTCSIHMDSCWTVTG